MSQVTVDDVQEALENVIDPELGLDFVELGLIYGVEVDGSHVHVTFSLTTPACPIGPQVTEILAEAGLAVAMETTLEELGGTVHAHPTVSEAVKEAALAALGRVIHV